ncbi:AraC family ligand binding domain-containing protein [Streptomyces sp. NPDC020571]|uniref:AraC family transcriptional regulator n=1 Tax=Streptomyces sp. NPDC020571 TaxID=3365079 RepID=UPI003796D8EF
MGTEARYWRDVALPLEAMRARFREHVYPVHSHDAYSFGITDSGAQRFRCRGAAHTSGAGMVMAFNPDEAHDGQKASELGYHYRIVHLGPALVREVLTDAADGGPGELPLFSRPVLDDPALAATLARLYAAVAGGTDPLVRDERVTEAVLAMTARGATRAPRHRAPVATAQRQLARRIRALLHEANVRPISADGLAAAAGCSRFALYRAFRAEYGMAPSDYQRVLRLRRARTLLAAGAGPAAVAADCGFADQPHMARWFRRTYGITPGMFVRAS